ncbi:hypothetical protein BN946_scf184346.g8 [Trametes cinnabarina]|uniref:Uncharacterized protein n=1 Tax=Pycnoporus cinnabarinus TaxID=5643 RepID=A0A060SMX7_PYCCI|nr:hypothetical protein BN946_scf184346.g8 [Trametes cinnabarina]
MDADALRRLKRADIQMLAKVNGIACSVADGLWLNSPPLFAPPSLQRAGIRANQATAKMIQDLLDKYAPELVPYMDSIPATTEQEAISRKMMRRQGLTSLPVPSPTPDASPVVRRSSRRATADPAPIASASASQAPVPAASEFDSISAAPVLRACRTHRNNQIASNATRSSNAQAGAAPPPLSQTQVSAGSSAAINEACGTRTSVRALSSNRALSAKAQGKQRAVEESTANALPQDTQTAGPQERGHSTARPPSPPHPVHPRRVFFPPTQEELERMRTFPNRFLSQQSSSSTFRSVPPFTFVPDPARAQAATTSNARPGANSSTSATQRTPRVASTPSIAGQDVPREALSQMPALPRVPVYRPPINQARDMINALAPLADRDAVVRENMREMHRLLDGEEERMKRIVRSAEWSQKLRMAMEELLFNKLKHDPRLLNGAGGPNDEQDTDARTSAAPAASPSTQAGAEREETTAEHKVRDQSTHTEDSEEQELQEVEEMTSREVRSSDLASLRSSVERSPQSKRRADDDSLEKSPRKRSCRSQRVR